MVKRIFYIILTWFLGFAAAMATDYADPKNWVMCEADKSGASFDVFYIYPTLFFNPIAPRMNMNEYPHIRKRVIDFTTEQAKLLVPHARAFAPAIRQLDYSHIAFVVGSESDWRRSSLLAPGANDALEAFRYYMKHFNNGRPYILLGHSQGAMDLYLMMLEAPEIAVKRGFVAAYLIGLPHLTAREISADMAPRGIRPAARENDLGVIIGWNTQTKGAKDPFFTMRKTYCINPLNWRTDATPAPANAHRGALVYDTMEKRARIVKNFCGAKIDRRSGALIVKLPKDDRYSIRRFAGSGVLHIHDIWFFLVALRENINLRVKTWCEKYGPKNKGQDQ